jgi:MFS family permease
MTVPIYITAAILAVVVAWTSDRVGKRSPFIVSFLCVMVVGFTMQVTHNVPLLQFMLTFPGVFLPTTPRSSTPVSSSQPAPSIQRFQELSLGWPTICQEVTNAALEWPFRLELEISAV